ncbi:MAG: hypothetical protein AAGA91_06995 [Pseudomonadota bacterium]
MNAYRANVVNGIVLILMPAWALVTSDAPSFTAFIPAAFGLTILLCSSGVKSQNKIVSHLVVILTLIVIFALFTPLRAAIDRDDAAAVIRVSLMLLASLVAIVFFIKSFIDARKGRQST